MKKIIKPIQISFLNKINVEKEQSTVNLDTNTYLSYIL